MVTLSQEDKARLAKLRQKAVSARWIGAAKISSKPSKSSIPYQGSNKHLFVPKTKNFFKKPVFEPKAVPSKSIPDFSTSFLNHAAGSVPQQNTPEKTHTEVELTREECFCAVMDLLLESMSKTDKASKEAAKNLLLVMGNEVGSSVSILVYNSYVRRYNLLREQYFLSMAANIKAKTIRISAEIVESLEQMAQTIKIELPPGLNLPRRA